MADRETYVIELQAKSELAAVLREQGARSISELQKLDREYREQVKELSKVERAARKAWGASSDGLKRLASAPFRSVTTGLAGIAAGYVSIRAAAGAVSDAADLQGGLAEVATIADISDMRAVRDEILDLSVLVNELPSTTARGFYQTVSAGIGDTSDALLVLDASARLARAGLAGTDETVDLTTTALNAYGKEVESVTDLSDDFFTTVRLGKTTIPELAGALGPALPLAAALGIELEEVLAGIVELTKRGVATPEAATQQRALFKSLLTQADEIDAALQRTGSSYDLNTIRVRGLLPVLAELRAATRDEAEVMEILGGRVEATNAFLGQTGAAGESAAQTLEALQNNTGATAEALAIINGTDAEKAKRVIRALRNESTAFGDAFLAAVADAIDELGGVEALQARLRASFEQFAPVVERAASEVLSYASDWTALGGDIRLARYETELWARESIQYISDVGEAIDERVISPWDDALFSGVDQAAQRFLDAARQGDIASNVLPGSLEEAGRRRAVQQVPALRELLEEFDAVLDLESRGVALMRGMTTDQRRVKVLREIHDVIVATTKAERDRDKARINAQRAVSKADRERLAFLREQIAALRSAEAGGAAGPLEADLSTSSLQPGLLDASPPSVSLESKAADALRLAEQQRLLAEAERVLAEEALAATERQHVFEELMVGLRQQANLSAEEQLALEFDMLEIDLRRIEAKGRELNLTQEQIQALQDARGELTGLSIQQSEELVEQLNRLLSVTANTLGRADFLSAGGAQQALLVQALREIKKEAEEAESNMKLLGLTLESVAEDSQASLTASGAGLFEDFILGAQDARDAWRDFQEDVLRGLARIAAQRLSGFIFDSAFSAIGFADGGVALGGIGQPLPVRAYSKGGIATEPQLAVYGEGSAPAEAFVPLPDGRSIGVKFLNDTAGGGATYITVQASFSAVDGRSIEERMPEWSRGVAKAVIRELPRNAALRRSLRGARGG